VKVFTVGEVRGGKKGIAPWGGSGGTRLIIGIKETRTLGGQKNSTKNVAGGINPKGSQTETSENLGKVGPADRNSRGRVLSKGVGSRDAVSRRKSWPVGSVS